MLWITSTQSIAVKNDYLYTEKDCKIEEIMDYIFHTYSD